MIVFIQLFIAILELIKTMVEKLEIVHARALGLKEKMIERKRRKAK